MWMILALAGAVFTSLTTILAKIGIKGVNSDFATAYRTVIVILCSLLLCCLTGSISQFSLLSGKNWLFLCLSGVATGCSWLCYYRALKSGSVNQVAPVDKSSFILSSILLLIFFFDDTTKGGDGLTIGMLLLSVAFIAVGTILMIDRRQEKEGKGAGWLLFAILSAVFAAVVSLFVKMGLQGIPSDLGTLIRTMVVFLFASTIVWRKGEYRGVKTMTKRSWLFLTLSGVATGGAWLAEYYALNMAGANPLAVNAMSKLAILLTMGFSYWLLKEKFSKRSLVGLSLLTLGILVVILFSL